MCTRRDLIGVATIPFGAGVIGAAVVVGLGWLALDEALSAPARITADFHHRTERRPLRSFPMKSCAACGREGTRAFVAADRRGEWVCRSGPACERRCRQQGKTIYG